MHHRCFAAAYILLWNGLEKSISDYSFRFSFEPAAKCQGHSVMFWANVRRKRDPAVHEILFILGSRVSMFCYTSCKTLRHLIRSFLKKSRKYPKERPHSLTWMNDAFSQYIQCYAPLGVYHDLFLSVFNINLDGSLFWFKEWMK